MEYLPNDTMNEIFSHLNILDLINISTTSKKLYDHTKSSLGKVTTHIGPYYSPKQHVVINADKIKYNNFDVSLIRNIDIRQNPKSLIDDIFTSPLRCICHISDDLVAIEFDNHEIIITNKVINVYKDNILRVSSTIKAAEIGTISTAPDLLAATVEDFYCGFWGGGIMSYIISLGWCGSTMLLSHGSGVKSTHQRGKCINGNCSWKNYTENLSHNNF
jgi:hypothetical protein